MASPERAKKERATSSRPEPLRAPVASDTLDIDERTTAIYLAAIEHPNVTLRTLLDRGFDADLIEYSMAVMERRGLVRHIDDHTWQVEPPDVAMPAFAARLEEYARTMREAMPAMARVYNASHEHRSVDSGFARLGSIEEMAAACRTVFANARAEVIGVAADTLYIHHLLSLPNEFHSSRVHNAAGEVLSSSLVVDLSLIAEDTFGSVLSARAAAGEMQRVATRLPYTVLVNDAGDAVLEFQQPAGAPLSAMAISTADMAEACRRAAWWMWTASQAWSASPARQRHTDAMEARVLQLLAGGLPDAAIARKLGVSQRTVERRTSRWMEQLGASSRFQAGVIAAKRGLI